MSVELEHAPVAVDWRRVAKLDWEQRGHLTRHWELVADGQLVAHFGPRAPLAKHHDVVTAAGLWQVRTSVWSAHEVSFESEETPRARTGKRGFRKTGIDRANEESLVWRNEGWFRHAGVLENGEGFPLVRYDEQRGFMSLGASIRLEDAAHSLPTSRRCCSSPGAWR